MFDYVLTSGQEKVRIFFFLSQGNSKFLVNVQSLVVSIIYNESFIMINEKYFVSNRLKQIGVQIGYLSNDQPYHGP